MTPVDETRAGELLDQLERWGYVEERAGHVQGTRKWNAKLQATAEKLNILASQENAPEGNPLVVAVSQTLANENLDLAPALFDDAVRVLVTLELTRMGPTKRALAGFPDVKLEGDVPEDAGLGYRA